MIAALSGALALGAAPTATSGVGADTTEIVEPSPEEPQPGEDLTDPGEEGQTDGAEVVGPEEDDTGTGADGGESGDGAADGSDPTLEEDPGDPPPAPAASETPDEGSDWKRPNIPRVPVNGATFNDASARANSPAAVRILSYVEDLIDLTPPGEAIRIAQYNLARERTVEKLVQAHKRGVNLQIVVNDRVLGNDVTQRVPYPRFRRLLGTDVTKDRFMVSCDRGCRTGPGSAMHTKFITISLVKTKDGDRRDILITASGNLTGWAANRQYNDMYLTVGRSRLVEEHNTIFTQLARDKRRTDAFQSFSQGNITTWFFPKPGGRQPDDPTWQAMQDISCRYTAGGKRRTTAVRVKMFTWNGNRGLALARRLYQLDQQGCRVEAIVGAPASTIVRELRRPGKNGGIAVWDSRVDRNRNGEKDLYTHMKALQIDGRIGGSRVRHVYTGSANWTPAAYTRGDEILVRLTGKKPAKQYRANFTFVKQRSERLSNTVDAVAVVTPY